MKNFQISWVTTKVATRKTTITISVENSLTLLNCAFILKPSFVDKILFFIRGIPNYEYCAEPVFKHKYLIFCWFISHILSLLYEIYSLNIYGDMLIMNKHFECLTTAMQLLENR